MPVSELQDYLLMARALISQGAVDVETPSPKMIEWARWAVRSADGVLTDAVAKLAEGTALARGERYIEMQLVAPGTTVNDPVVDLDVADRFRLLRLVAFDHHRFTRVGLASSTDGTPAVLFSSFDDAVDAARGLSTESDFADEPHPVLMYATTFQPALPADFLEEGMDPLGPAREFLGGLDAGTRDALLNHLGSRGQTIRL
jgi:hypothetical protein